MFSYFGDTTLETRPQTAKPAKNSVLKLVRNENANIRLKDNHGETRKTFRREPIQQARSSVPPRAIAASSAFPVCLTPVVLRNYSAEKPQTEPEWIQDSDCMSTSTPTKT